MLKFKKGIGPGWLNFLIWWPRLLAPWLPILALMVNTAGYYYTLLLFPTRNTVNILLQKKPFCYFLQENSYFLQENSILELFRNLFRSNVRRLFTLFSLIQHSFQILLFIIWFYHKTLLAFGQIRRQEKPQKTILCYHGQCGIGLHRNDFWLGAVRASRKWTKSYPGQLGILHVKGLNLQD